MNKFNYLILAFKHNAYRKKAFLLSIFSVIQESQNDKLINIPFAFLKEGDKGYFLKENEDGTKDKVYIDNVNVNEALFNKDEDLVIKLEDKLWNLDSGEIKTTIGRFLVNIVVLYEAFGEKIPFINDKINGGKLREIIDDMMVDNPDINGNKIPPNKASVNECLKVTKQLDYLIGLNHIFVKASSYDLFTVDPEIIRVRDEELARLEKEGKLEDEIAIAELINKLVAMDAKIQYNGPSRDLFIKHDYIANSRKKMFLIFDMIPDFHTGKFRLLKNALQEGWDFSQMDAYANTAVSGSYDRGVGTARGGTEFKIAISLTNAIKVIEGDCGSTRFENVTINKYNYKGWVSGYYLNNNKLVEITNDNVKSLIGKTIPIRVPQYCKQPNGNVCSTCCGSRLGDLKNRISSEVGLIFSQYQLTSMKSIHVSKLDTVSANLDEIIR